MKASVINSSSPYYGGTAEVKLISYKFVYGVILESGEKVEIPYEDVEFIFDHNWEKNVVRHRDILKISLPGAVSLKFYAAACFIIEEHFKGEIENILILWDSNEKAKRGFWYKKMAIMVNDSCPLYITASGKEYTDLYNINIEDMDINNFEDECEDGICKIKKQISKSIEQLKSYEKALRNVKHGRGTRNKNKAIGGR